MQFYKKQGDKLICLLCSYYCKLKKGQRGICGVNENVGDRISCLVYGHVSALNIDPIEKKPLYHFLPNSKSLSLGTVGCNFKCSFCQNHGISQEKRIDKSRYFSPQDIVKIALENKCESISYTYNEPTIFYPYAKDIAMEAKKYGIKNVFVSNGFESSEVIDHMRGLIDAVNIDLKCFSKKYYKKNLGGSLDGVLENLKHFKKNGIWLEITTLIVPTKNDSKEELEQIARFIRENLGEFAPWHISAFHPNYKDLHLPQTPYKSLKLAYDIGKNIGLKYVYMGNIGFENDTICPYCGKAQIKRKFYNILENNVENGHCKHCKEKIHGVYKKMSNIRKSAFSGSFYPANKNEVLQYINHFNSNLNIEGSFNTKAIIVPHAGYIYSGFTANVAYNIAQSQKEKTIFVIGPSHRVYVQGASISLYDSYETPLGNIDVDKQFALHLKDKYAFLDFSPDAHESEHSTETQAPFIKHYFSNSRIIEIVYGKLDYKDLSSLLEEILEEDDFFVVISTDLSHFYTQEEANKIDNICLNAIAKKDMNLFDQGCEACGKIGVQAIIYCAIKKDLQTNLLHYCTSYDRTRDPSRVVGYVSALVGTA